MRPEARDQFLLAIGGLSSIEQVMALVDNRIFGAEGYGEDVVGLHDLVDDVQDSLRALMKELKGRVK